MSRTVYVNGSFVPEEDAKISVFDRAFLFAEGVYEVTAVLAGKPLDLENHLARLDRSLAEMQIAPPLGHGELRALHAELIALNKVDRVDAGTIAKQIERAAALGDFHALHPVSAKTEDGIPALREELFALLPEGPLYFPPGETTDAPLELRRGGRRAHCA